MSCEPKDLPTIVEISEGSAVVKFSHQSTMTDVTSAAMELDQQNIKMDFIGSGFFEDGKLRELSLKVTLPNGTTGTTKADLSSLQFKYYGFTLSKEGHFKVGNF